LRGRPFKVKVAFLSLGCKVNQAEMAQMEGLLAANSFRVVRLDDSPDLCIINTCAVTAKSDYQSRQLIRRAARAGARVIVTGCYSELNSDSVADMEGVEAVIKNEDKLRIIAGLARETATIFLDSGAGRTRLFLKIQDGCSRHCSYCVIPRARGKPRSLKVRELIERISAAAARGTKEVVLSGIHLGLYGEDLKPKVPLSELVSEIIEKTGIERVRLSSLEITELDGKLLELFQGRRLCRHLHIPLQSGDDRILGLMNRPYNSAFFRETVLSLSRRLGDIGLGTDVIAGFPGETNRQFDNTLRLLEALPFTYLHVFPYSRRPGTPAADMPGEVTPSVKKQRAAALRALSQRKKGAYMAAQVGQTLDVLVEEQGPEGQYRGTSSNYLKVRFRSHGLHEGSVVPVRVMAVHGDGLEGEYLK
jgi:threonylcarbamoyladenosine tRNA methylthiotransferase MtaB